MNRWHVYEYLKRCYQDLQYTPHISELVKRFDRMEFAEIEEGVAEFEAVKHYLCQE